jgi:hypothetical protein
MPDAGKTAVCIRLYCPNQTTSKAVERERRLKTVVQTTTLEFFNL